MDLLVISTRLFQDTTRGILVIGDSHFKKLVPSSIKSIIQISKTHCWTLKHVLRNIRPCPLYFYVQINPNQIINLIHQDPRNQELPNIKIGNQILKIH